MSKGTSVLRSLAYSCRACDVFKSWVKIVCFLSFYVTKLLYVIKGFCYAMSFLKWPLFLVGLYPHSMAFPSSTCFPSWESSMSSSFLFISLYSFSNLLLFCTSADSASKVKCYFQYTIYNI